ncbi:MAG: hypothetical protein ACOX2F_05275 [bacterium]
MLKEAVETAYLHYNRALNNYEEIKNWTIDEKLFEDREKVKTADAFIFRFIKLQDYMGGTLFKRVLESVGEYKDNMSLLDELDKLEKLEVIENADEWMRFRKIRNILVHEYPDNAEQISQGISKALSSFVTIGKILENITHYIKTKNLSPV